VAPRDRRAHAAQLGAALRVAALGRAHSNLSYARRRPATGAGAADASGGDLRPAGPCAAALEPRAAARRPRLPAGLLLLLFLRHADAGAAGVVRGPLLSLVAQDS